MYLVPIYAQNWNDSLTQYWLFLERNGTHCMEIASEADAQQFCETNDISGTLLQRGDILFLIVDPKTTDLAQFYSWKEVSPGSIPPKEAWRNFMWASSPSSDDFLGVNGFLSGISLGPNISVYEIVTAFRKPS